MVNVVLFNKLIGMEKSEVKGQVHNRLAVRAVIVQNNQLLMVKNKKGDIKFPGGGIESGESHEEALKREVVEETGYKLSCGIEHIGRVVERRIDQYDSDAIFEMESNYYKCELSGHRVNQSLDQYEEELGFEPVWVEIGEAIIQNKAVLDIVDRNAWVEREIYVLTCLAEVFSK